MKKRICWRVFVLLGLVAALGVLAATPALADPVTLVANFDGGGADPEENWVTNVVDAYPGMAGEGWATAWQKATRYAAMTETVLNTTPLDDGGNYLNSVLTANAGETTYGRGAIARSYAYNETTNPGGISLEYEQTITFKFRPEEAAFDDSGGYDRYTLFDYWSLQSNTGGDTGWHLSAQGVGELPVVPGNWMAHDWSGAEVLVDTGVPLAAGVVYNFEITVRGAAEARKWDLKLNDGAGGHSYDSTFPFEYPNGLTWRKAEEVSPLAGGFVHFAAGCRPGGDTRDYSLDSLTIVGQGGTPPPPWQPPNPLSPVVSRFTDGNGDTVVDGYVGMRSGTDGWESAWVPTTSIGGTVDHQVRGPGYVGHEGVEIKEGSGRYLSFVADHDDSTSRMKASVGRDYKTSGPDDYGINVTQDHTIQFTMRIDENVDDEYIFAGANDKYAIFCSQDGPSGMADAPSLWQITANGDTLAGMAKEWLFYDGNGDGTGVDVETNIALVTDGVYDFTIVVHPGSETCDMTVDDGLNDPFTALGLGWRASPGLGVPPKDCYLCFGAQSDADEDVRAFSLDDIVITQILEPIPGDATGDGHVNEADAQRLAQNWGATELVGEYTWWQMGDFDGDHRVGPKDAAIMAANWGYGPGEANGVPEPSSVVLLLGMIGAMLLWRRR